MSQGRLSARQRWLPPAPVLGSRDSGSHSGLEHAVGLDGGDDDLLQLLQRVAQIPAFEHVLGENRTRVTSQPLQQRMRSTLVGGQRGRGGADLWFQPRETREIERRQTQREGRRKGRGTKVGR